MDVAWYLVHEGSRSGSRSALLLGFRMAWANARHLVAAVLALQFVSAVALATLLQAGRELVRELNVAGVNTGDLTRPIALLAAAMFATGVSSATSRELGQLIAERLERSVERELAVIAASVSYATYERSDFHDLLARSTASAASSAYRLVFGFSVLIETMATAGAITFVLLSSVPELLPALVLVSAPLVLASRASGRMAYRAAYDMAPNDRRRRSIVQAFAGRPAAREVRVLALTRPLEAR